MQTILEFRSLFVTGPYSVHTKQHHVTKHLYENLRIHRTMFPLK